MTSLPARRAFATGLGIAALTATLIAGASPAAAKPKHNPGPPPVNLQLLAINDFHGQLEPPSGSSSTLPDYPDPDGSTGPLAAPAFGGAEYLATQVRQLEAETKKQNTLTVAAGDLIGASPLLSAAFHDEPTIEAMNLLGLDYASVGNHEFDEGSEELLRMQNGGCLAEESCPDGSFDGADFQYLSANAFYENNSDETLLPPYAVHKVQGIKVGFIGMTLEGTDKIVTPSGVAGLDFGAEVETANRYAAELQEQGVEAIVVLLHEGGSQARGSFVDDCNGLTGPIKTIAPAMDPAIDVIITGHTHQAYSCRQVGTTFVRADSTSEGRLVTSASSASRLVTDIDLTLDRRTGDVLTSVSDNVPVARDVPKDSAQSELIARYREFLGPIAGEEVGLVDGDIKRDRKLLFTEGGRSVLGESPLGNLVADAMLAATPDADLALMNPGGVRADLLDGPVTYEEAFNVQPFGNYLTTITLTEAQLQCVLEQQFVVGNDNRNILQPSEGFSYRVDPDGTTGTAADECSGNRVPNESVAIDGVPIQSDDQVTYDITVNNFLADGGDGFTTLTRYSQRVDVADPEDDLAALVAYLKGNQGISAPATDRINIVGQP